MILGGGIGVSRKSVLTIHPLWSSGVVIIKCRFADKLCMASIAMALVCLWHIF